MTDFRKRLAQLKDDLVTQGTRVSEMVLHAVECFFAMDRKTADDVIGGDDAIDHVNIAIERASVPLLALGETDEHEIRSVLTIVKINNELERMADCAVDIGEAVKAYGELSGTVPETFRVMANSVVGMVRDSVRALRNDDTALAEQVLAFDHTVDRFKREIILDAEEKVASGAFSAQFAFRLLSVTRSLERMADHCTNICEQVIYVESGLIVRHLPEGWSKPAQPG